MYRILSFIALGVLITGCAGEQEQLRQKVVENYADMVYASYDDAVNEAIRLRSAIHTFLADPTAETMEAAKKAWIDARPAYLQTEAYRFYDGPIDGEDGLEGFINAWPLDENFIDYVVDETTGKPVYGGVINNPADFPELTADLLIKENEVHGEADVKIGYHAIEFLLWGQDLYDESPGKRPYTDYLTGAGATAPNGERRKAYLRIVTDLLVDHLTEVRDAWEPGSTYRSAFAKKENIESSLTSILSGLGKLSKGELAGERMTVALENKDQEDEHSCFSDNTRYDIIYNQLGIQNVYRGSYKRTDGSEISGPGFADLVALKDKALSQSIDDHINKTLAATEAIPAPFDQAIIHQPEKIQAAIRELRAQSDEIQNIAQAIGLILVIPETNE